MNTSLAHTTTKIFSYELSDVLRSRWMLVYLLFFLGATELLIRLGGEGPRALLSLTNAVLILIPLVSILFGTIYLYQARPFTELMLTQPIRRTSLFLGLYAGLAIPLLLCFAVGVSLPFLVRGTDAATYAPLAVLLFAGSLLTLTFLAVAFWVASAFEDRLKGMGAAFGIWLAAAVLYDGLVLAAVTAFAHYPLERPMIGLILLNPVDLARVMLLLQFDVSALMGYTGAVFERFFGSTGGMGLATLALLAWWILPFTLGLRRFRQRDF